MTAEERVNRLEGAYVHLVIKADIADLTRRLAAILCPAMTTDDDQGGSVPMHSRPCWAVSAPSPPAVESSLSAGTTDGQAWP